MITKLNWEEFKEHFNAQTPYGKYKYDNSEITRDLLLSIFITPFTIVIDILIFPIQIIYLMCLKIINKIRRNL